jgi:CrcB protein
MVKKFSMLVLAGAAGTLARYALAGLVHRLNGSTFPWGTLAVNVAGCLAAGFAWTMFEARWPASGPTRMVVLIGFLGAFTTFSTLVLETGEMLRASQWLYAGANLLLQNLTGLVALFAGAALARAL